MNLENLKSPELQEKLKNASAPEEILIIAQEEGYSLSDEELNAVAGGENWFCNVVECISYCPSYDGF